MISTLLYGILYLTLLFSWLAVGVLIVEGEHGVVTGFNSIGNALGVVFLVLVALALALVGLVIEFVFGRWLLGFGRDVLRMLRRELPKL